MIGKRGLAQRRMKIATDSATKPYVYNFRNGWEDTSNKVSMKYYTLTVGELTQPRQLMQV